MKMNQQHHCNDDEGSTLSADAAPFHPFYEPVNVAIYNDGMPSMTLISERDRFDILHGIEDEAIDEQFPPDAEDAYELEAAEAFVIEMANLALLEEREERARRSFSHIQRRWEVRRAAGPSGRPRPAMHLIVPVQHNTAKNYRYANQCKAIVPHSHHHHPRDVVTHDRMYQPKSMHRMEPRMTKAMMSLRRPIQQPRKNS